jgi:dTDP-4-amino-4,6-dideoxygalactose transaminase
MKIQFSPPDISDLEIQNVVDSLKSGWITTGPKTKLLERKMAEYVGLSQSVCLNSATAGLELVLRIMGIGPGDEVITSAYTYTASASVIVHVGAKPILCDIQEHSFDFDEEDLKRKINSRTKAIIPVDIAGKIVNYKKLYDLVNDFSSIFSPNNEEQKKLGRILILADAAHSFGAKKDGKYSGNFADFSVFSLHAVKNLTSAEGGNVVWSKQINAVLPDLYKKFMLLSLHGQTKDALSKTKSGSWEYDIITTGYKCNMTDIHAAIGLAQLERYDNLLKRRREIYNLYLSYLNVDYFDIFDHLSENDQSSMHLMLVNIKNIDDKQRNVIIKDMAEHEVPLNVHYKPLPLLTAYKKLGFDIKNFNNSYNRYKNIITLPLHTLLSDDDVKFICEKLNDIVGNLYV